MSPRRIIVAVPAKPVPVAKPAKEHFCEDCGAKLAASEIRAYRRESNMGPNYRGIPRCCDDCASSWDAPTVSIPHQTLAEIAAEIITNHRQAPLATSEPVGNHDVTIRIAPITEEAP